MFVKDSNKEQWMPINVGKFADNIDGGIVSKSGGTVNGNCCGDVVTCSQHTAFSASPFVEVW